MTPIPGRIAADGVVHAVIDFDGSATQIGAVDRGGDAEDAGATAEVEYAIETSSLPGPASDRGQTELRGLVQARCQTRRRAR